MEPLKLFSSKCNSNNSDKFPSSFGMEPFKLLKLKFLSGKEVPFSPDYQFEIE